MPEASGYESHLSRGAVASVAARAKEQQRLGLDLAPARRARATIDEVANNDAPGAGWR